MIKQLIATCLLLSGAHAVGAETAIFAGGCFWCMEEAFQETKGVEDVVSGFTGGSLENPTYSGNHEGHYEAVLVTFDPSVVTYEDLLAIFWHNIDPFDEGGQFCDRGPSYRSAIFYRGDIQLILADASRSALIERFEEHLILTELLPATKFWPVEEYHQDYYLKNPIRYAFYKKSCGRKARLQEIWGDTTSH